MESQKGNAENEAEDSSITPLKNKLEERISGQSENDNVLGRRILPRCSILDKSIQGSERLRIAIGPQFQAEIPEFIGSSKEFQEERGICVWSAEKFSEAEMNLRQLDEFVNIAADYGLAIDKAMELLLKSNFVNSLCQLKEFSQQHRDINWSKNEIESFLNLLNIKSGKNFARISKNLEKDLKECVKMYYDLKGKSCLTSPNFIEFHSSPQIIHEVEVHQEKNQRIPIKSECTSTRA